MTNREMLREAKTILEYIEKDIKKAELLLKLKKETYKKGKEEFKSLQKLYNSLERKKKNKKPEDMDFDFGRGNTLKTFVVDDFDAFIKSL